MLPRNLSMVISVEEAREILGKDGEKLTDDEIVKLIDDLDGIARATIRAYTRGEFKKGTLEK